MTTFFEIKDQIEDPMMKSLVKLFYTLKSPEDFLKHIKQKPSILPNNLEKLFSHLFIHEPALFQEVYYSADHLIGKRLLPIFEWMSQQEAWKHSDMQKGFNDAFRNHQNSMFLNRLTQWPEFFEMIVGTADKTESFYTYDTVMWSFNPLSLDLKHVKKTFSLLHHQRVWTEKEYHDLHFKLQECLKHVEISSMRNRKKMEDFYQWWVSMAQRHHLEQEIEPTPTTHTHQENKMRL